METKVCSKCGIEKELINMYFNKNKMHKDGFRSECKCCQRKYVEDNKEKISDWHKQYRKENKEKCAKYNKNNKEKIAKQKKIYNEENKEKIKEYRKQYYINNKIKIMEYREKNKNEIAIRDKQYRIKNKEIGMKIHRKYRIKNFEKLSKQEKQYREDNKEKYREYGKQWAIKNADKCTIYRQKRRAAKYDLPNALTILQWNQAKIYFNNCCAFCGQKLPLAQEHFLPLSKGGEYTVNNIIPSCISCNSSKFNHDFFEWYPTHERYNKKREQKILKYLGYKDNNQQLKII